MCEVPWFHSFSRSYKNPADYTDCADKTDPADHADPPIEICYIMQIVHTPFRYRSYRSHRFHTGRSDRYCRLYRSCRSNTHRQTCADHAGRPDPTSLKMYRSGELDRSHPGQNVLIVQIIQILLRYTSMKIVTRQIPFRLNICLPIRSTRSHLSGHFICSRN